VVFNRNLQFYLANPGNVLVRVLISFTVGVFQGIVFFRSLLLLFRWHSQSSAHGCGRS
jgi:hypothetical protein